MSRILWAAVALFVLGFWIGLDWRKQAPAHAPDTTALVAARARAKAWQDSAETYRARLAGKPRDTIYAELIRWRTRHDTTTDSVGIHDTTETVTQLLIHDSTQSARAEGWQLQANAERDGRQAAEREAQECHDSANAYPWRQVGEGVALGGLVGALLMLMR